MLKSVLPIAFVCAEVIFAAAPSLGAISHVAGSDKTGNVASSTGYTVTLPQTPANGDLLLISLFVNGNNPTVTSTGWECAHAIAPGNNVNGYFCDTISDGSTTTFTFSFSVSGASCYIVNEWAGAIQNTGRASGLAGATAGTTTNNTITIPAPDNAQPALPVIMEAGSTAVVPSGFTQLGANNFCTQIAAHSWFAYKNAETTTSYTYPASGSGEYLMGGMLLDGSAGGSGVDRSFMGSWGRRHFEALLDRGY